MKMSDREYYVKGYLRAVEDYLERADEDGDIYKVRAILLFEELREDEKRK